MEREGESKVGWRARVIWEGEGGRRGVGGGVGGVERYGEERRAGEGMGGVGIGVVQCGVCGVCACYVLDVLSWW